MNKFKKRSSQMELLDGKDIPFRDIAQNMRELNFINTYLGGHAITIKGLEAFLKKETKAGKQFHIVEIGCGGGDNLEALQNWLKKRGIKARLEGIDINRECIKYAQSKTSQIHYIHSDYHNVEFKQKPDIIFSSLFCHHFQEKDLIPLLLWMKRHSTLGFFINDLHRHPVAYYSIKLLTTIFSRSYLVKNDAPLSVKRAFVKKDWQQLFAAANIFNFQIKWKWAFRWLITCYTNEPANTI